MKIKYFYKTIADTRRCLNCTAMWHESHKCLNKPPVAAKKGLRKKI